jgi:hypothetical protein
MQRKFERQRLPLRRRVVELDPDLDRPLRYFGMLNRVVLGAAVGGLVLAVLLVGVAGVGIVSAALADSRQHLCTDAAPAAKVANAFAMANVSDYQRHIPRMGRSPELEVTAPGYVVVFAGTVDLPSAQAAPPATNQQGAINLPPLAQGPQTGVVCVVTNNQPTFYVNVDSTGLQP